MKKIKYPGLVLALGLMLFGVWNWVVRAPVLDYGKAGDVYFVPSRAAPGERVMMNFNSVTWYRLCPSKLYTFFQPEKGVRIDLPVHEVSYPSATGKLTGKARPFNVPHATDGMYGKGIVSGYVASSCWPFEGLPITTALPDVPLEILRQ